MTEISYLWDNPGVGDSPAAPGTGDDVLMSVIFRMLLNGTGNRGVLRDWLNELEVTDAGGLNVSVASGGAIDYGLFYESTAAETLAIDDDSTRYVVVRRSWAAQTARLAQVAAVTQTAGVTYDIPLATVITAAGDISSVTPTREWVEYSTDLLDDVVQEAHIGADQVTTGKLENQTRHIVLSGGMLEPDATNPATWVSAGTPYTNYWRLQDAATEVVWCTFRVPVDYTGSTVTVYVWNKPVSGGGAGSVEWGWNALSAQPSAVLGASAGTLAVVNTGRVDEMYQDPLTTLTVSNGDIVHMEIMRNGAAGGDTLAADIALHAVEIEYTADS